MQLYFLIFCNPCLQFYDTSIGDCVMESPLLYVKGNPDKPNVNSEETNEKSEKT
jgi:hypothetical protein